MTRTEGRRAACALVAAVFLFTSLPQASFGDIIFDNFNGAFDATPLTGFAVMGPDTPLPFDHALAFSVPSSSIGGFYLSSITVPMAFRSIFDRTPTLNVAVHEDDGGSPGVALQLSAVTMATTDFEVIVVDFPGTLFLSENTTYWVALTGIARSHYLWAEVDPPLDTGTHVFRMGSGSPWESAPGDPACRVDGSLNPVPVQASTWGEIKALFGSE